MVLEIKLCTFLRILVNMKLNEDYGKIKIKLNELLKKNGMSKNKLYHKAEMSWSQIDNYCNNTVTRLDTYALCKLCTVFECKIEDLIEFAPTNEK